jgi:predicted transcriptional regulator
VKDAPPPDKLMCSFRLSAKSRTLLRALAEARGVSSTDIIEMAIRDAAKKEGLK